MSHNPLAPIWERLEQLRPVFFHTELGGTLAGCREWLVESQVLVETTPSLHAQCAECGNGNLVRAVPVSDARAGGNAWRLPCPTCGPIPIEADGLRRWVVDVPVLLGRVSGAARIREARGVLVENHLWFVGTAPWGGSSRQIYFVRAAHARTRGTVAAALALHPRALLLHPTEHALQLWGPATPNPAAALESIVSFGPDGIGFDTAAVVARLPTDPQKRPVPKRAVRAEQIARLTAELIEHLKRARDHAYATRALSRHKEAELLPLPTMKQLGELVGLEPYQVSRCFADETARELNLYWNLAADLDAVMNFKGPISTGADT